MNQLRNTFMLAVLIVTFQTILFPTSSCNQKRERPNEVKDSVKADSTLKNQEIYIDLKKILARNDLVTNDVNVKYDQFFKTSKRYRGYSLNTIIDSAIKSGHFDTAGAVIIFECADGYKPVMDLAKIYRGAKGYLVFKDLEKGLVGNWPDSLNKMFSPFYLVWDNVEKEDHSFTWPYGLIGLRLMPGNLEYKTIYPYKDSTLVKGFNAFKQNCFKCHSINKVGGTMGPEFNLPKNITEYWKEEDIIAFVKNPSSYRYNSHMPGITNVSDADLHEIVNYIRSMKNNKIIN
jgi:mono/diheme cytochrome c family protein